MAVTPFRRRGVRSAPSAPMSAQRQDRANKHVVAAHIETEAYKDFKRLGVDMLKTTDALLHEALALLFVRHDRPVPPSILRKLKDLGISVDEQN
jgi:hypothetical protein